MPSRTQPKLLSVACLVGWIGLLAAAVDAAPTLTSARQLALRGSTAEAAEQYTTLLAQEPVAATLGLARCEQAQGRSAAAIKLLETAVAAHPKVADLPAELAWLAFARGNLVAAQKFADTALQLDSQSVLAHWVQFVVARDTGHRQQADQQLPWFKQFYEQLKTPPSAEALRILGWAWAEQARRQGLSARFQFLVNDLVEMQLEVEPNCWFAHYEAGLLFAEKSNHAEATRAFQAALKLNPQAAEVYAALATMAVERFQWDNVQRLARQALQLNPELLAAHLALADIQIANFKLAEAAQLLESNRALNPASEATLGRLAACYWVLDPPALPAGPATRFDKLVAEVNARNAQCGVFYFRLATALDTRRRFDDAVRYYQLAIDRAPDLTGPEASLGLLCLRLGEETRGKELLEAAFKKDPFHVKVKNTLEVLDVLGGYESLETEHFHIKFSGEKDRILARYVAKYLEQEYPALCQQFGFQVPQPSLLEIFSRARNTSGHSWFSTRMTGQPYLGTVGACAGKMVALVSPSEKPFNWKRVVKHEFIHVINLQQTEFNVPHWFAEGLAVVNEGYPRPAEWNLLLQQRIPTGQLFTLDNLNLGFIRPESGEHWQLAYCQAELYVEYLFQRFGPDAAAKLLAEFAKKKDTPEAIQAAFGVSVPEIEIGYRRYLLEVMGELQQSNRAPDRTSAEIQKLLAADPENEDLQAELALAHLQREEYPQARKLAKEVLNKKPKHGLAGYVLARVFLVIGEEELAQKLLENCLDRAAPQMELLNLLAGLKLKAQAYAEAAELYELGSTLEPSRPQWLNALAAVYLKSKQVDKLRPVLERLAAQDAEGFTVRKKLAQLARAAGDDAETIRWCQECLAINVLERDIHLWLAEASRKLKSWPTAIEEYSVAVELDPSDTEAYFAWAETCLLAEQKATAKQVLEKMLQAHPNHAAALKLWEQVRP